jgi:hypothetical protein
MAKSEPEGDATEGYVPPTESDLIAAVRELAMGLWFTYRGLYGSDRVPDRWSVMISIDDLEVRAGE